MVSISTKYSIFLLLILLKESSGEDERSYAFKNGDFIIGALLPIHYQPGKNQSQSMQCGAVRELYGIQRAEVALQTIDKINQDPDFLPNVTLGIEVRDDCWYAPVALQQSIELIRDSITPLSSLPDTCSNTSTRGIQLAKGRGPLIGVVGPSSSSLSLQVQNLLQLFHLPQVGYSATSKDLSDKSRFNYFLRVVPSDHYQAQVLLDIVKHFNWTYVSVVNTDENYGQAGIQAFRDLIKYSNTSVCIAREDSVLSNAADEVFDKVIRNLKGDKEAHVVVCFCEGLTVQGLLKALKRLNLSNHFLLIGSDGWADRNDVTEKFEQEAWGSLSIRIRSPYVTDFDEYYWALNPENNTRNPWFRELWQKRFACIFPGLTSPASVDFTAQDSSSENVSVCTGRESLSDKYKQDSKLSFVGKAIYTLAHGLRNMHIDICGNKSFGDCEELLPFNGSLFKSYLLNVSFDYEGDLIKFDKNGDPPGRYDILNFQKLPNGTYHYVHVGDWNNKSLTWSSEVQFGAQPDIKSVCSHPCSKGHYKRDQVGKDKNCCWACIQCPSGQVANGTADKCRDCEKGFKPNADQSVCLLLPIEFVQWFDPQAIVVLTFASLGFLITWLAFAVFVKYNNTPVVKSSTKELSYIILVGMTISHASVFPILAKPTPLMCALSRFLPGLSFALIYAALLTKTNRIARILAVSKKSFPTRKRLFMSGASQVFITTLLIVIQVIMSLWMIFYEKPDIAHSYYGDRTVLECNTTPVGILVPLAYDFFLISLCTLYALKTRNVPENFNEAKFIGFAMYTTCVIWVAFVPIYFGSGSKVTTMCICVSLSAIVTWMFLFLPKLYIILLHPERNNRSCFTTSKSIRCHIGSRVSTITSKTDSSISYYHYAPKEIPVMKSFACQTGADLLEVLLSPKLLMEAYPKKRAIVPQITERDCGHDDTCQYKNITIRLPDSSEA